VIHGKKFPKEVIDHWPEVFGEIILNVIPLKYLDRIQIRFKNGKLWEIDMRSKRNEPDWSSFEKNLKEMLASYESEIDNLDFKIDTERIKKDIMKNTNRFLKRRKLL
jgi:hypothetical protein